MRRIVFTRPNGKLSVIEPVINVLGEASGFTEEQAEQRAWDSMPADAINPQWIDEDAIPKDRTLRDSWTFDGKSIVVDATKIKIGTAT